MVKEKEDEVDSLGSWTQEEENKLSHAMPQLASQRCSFTGMEVL